MILRFSKDLATLDVYASGIELSQYLGRDRDAQGRRAQHPGSARIHIATFHHPVLVTDNHRIAALGDTDTTLRDTLFALYGASEKTIEYDGLSLSWVQGAHPTVWGPSIDTLLFCRALGKLDFSGAQAAAEIGSGSGFLSAYLLRNTPALHRATLVDFNPEAIASSREWIGDPRARFHAGDGIGFLESGQYDLVLCNPPYIPRPGSIDNNPYEGVGLLVHLIEHAREYLTPHGVLVTNISSLCRRIADSAIANAGVSARAIDTLEVPLKVYNVLNNEEWMDYLVKEKGLHATRHDGYDYWHTIAITEIRPGREL
jgi:release factor glutamine methyltransferase